MAASFITSIGLHFAHIDAGNTSRPDYAIAMLLTTAISTLVWVTVTFLTRPEDDAVLERFYRRVRPGGIGWRRVSERLGFGSDTIPGGSLAWINWIAGVAAVYSAVFGVGEFLVGSSVRGWVYSLVAMGSFLLIQRNLRADKTLERALTAPHASN